MFYSLLKYNDKSVFLKIYFLSNDIVTLQSSLSRFCLQTNLAVSNKKNGCKPKEDNFIKSIYLSEFENIHKNFEEINDDISNKNILLIDEIIGRGTTMKVCVEYLEKIKKVSSITKLVYQKHESANIYLKIKFIYGLGDMIVKNKR